MVHAVAIIVLCWEVYYSDVPVLYAITTTQYTNYDFHYTLPFSQVALLLSAPAAPILQQAQ